MENRRMIFVYAAVVLSIVVAVVVFVGILSLGGGTADTTKIRFTEKASEGNWIVKVEIESYSKQGNLEIRLQTDDRVESNSIVSPRSGKSVIVGDEVEGGLQKGDTIEVVEIRPGVGVISTYTVQANNGTTVKRAGG